MINIGHEYFMDKGLERVGVNPHSREYLFFFLLTNHILAFMANL